ncbi:DUF4843 domain-containing protein [Porphyromonas sp.]
MNRRYALTALAVASLGLLSSCSKSDVYDGEYSKDGFYNESPVVYFPNDGADTIVTQNLAFLEDTDGKITYTFDVRLLGRTSATPLSYKVTVDAAHSTAKEGVQFDALESSYTIPAKATKGSFSIKLNRLKISTVQQKDGKYIINRNGVHTPIDALSDMKPGDEPLLKYDTIRLQLTSTPDLRTGLNHHSTLVFCVTNQLAIPFWWQWYETVYLGKYSEGKYRMLMAAYGRPKEDKDPILDIISSRSADVQYDFFTRLEKYMDEHGEEKPAVLVSLLARYR